MGNLNDPDAMTVVLTKEQGMWLRARAKRLDRSVSWLVRLIVGEYQEAQAKVQAKAKEA